MIYWLDVSYAQKEFAKSYGARWNKDEGSWFYEGETLPKRLEKYVRSQSSGKLEDKSNTSSSSGVGTEYKTVTEWNKFLKVDFKKNPAFRNVLIKGEVTNFKGVNRGNYYFSIKDENSSLEVVLWARNSEQAIDFELENGQLVGILGDFEFSDYVGRSQLIASKVVNLGEGAYEKALRLLYEKLQKEGLFELRHKKPLPKHPKKIGIVTARGGQAIKDICKVSKKRNPFVELYLYAVNVQGKDAAKTTINGIRVLDKMGMDVIIVGRGGGSDEDLKEYNNEELARVVFAARTPIISAVGHEGNFTLIDEVSDKRAATPSEAAELAVPDIGKDMERLDKAHKLLTQNMNYQIKYRKDFLDTQKKLLEANSPRTKLKQKATRFENAKKDLRVNMDSILGTKRNRFRLCVERLHGLSPTGKLINGFGYISSGEKPIRSVKNVKVGDNMSVLIHDGKIESTITKISEETIKENA